MYVDKRDGTSELVDFNKIMNRIKYLAEGSNNIGEKLTIDYVEIAKKVVNALINHIKTNQLDELAAEECAYRIGEHIDYGKLASRLIISNHHKNTISSFSQTMNNLYNNSDDNNNRYQIVTDKFINAVNKYADVLDEIVNKSHINDYKVLDYFGFKTLYKSYLIKYKLANGTKGQERYQHLLMRQAVAIYIKDNYELLDLEGAINCYNGLTNALYTHATPTLLNSGKANAQLSSCFLLGMYDSVDGMYECIRRSAHISKGAGGIGIHISGIRANGSKIRGTGGKSDGILPLAKVINNEALHVNQGGARPGAIALYIEPWHADIFDFLELKLPSGLEARRARDLFYALWIPDLFMERLKLALNGNSDVVWSLMCPDKCPKLNDTYGTEFNELYMNYEMNGNYIRQVPILKLWDAILTCQKETGTPYMCYKDNVNRKSNQSNIGIIRSSNLCAEIVQYSDHSQYATCNLGSINLTKMITNNSSEMNTSNIDSLYFDYNLLYKTAYQLTINLNNVIDINHYPVIETAISNFQHRPIGMGVQGLADVFMLLNLPFDSPNAREINKNIFETIYYAALCASNDLAKKRTEKLNKDDLSILKYIKELSQKYQYINNYISIVNREQKQKSFNEYENKMFNSMKLERDSSILLINSYINSYNLPSYTYEYSYINLDETSSKYTGSYSSFIKSPASKGILQYDMWNTVPSSRWNWTELKENIKNYGLRNSLLVAVMPTATTAHILGNVECIEPITSNLYSRQTTAGSFMIANKYLQQEMIKRGLWTPTIKDKIMLNRGSVQNIDEIPNDLKMIFKTAWEISKKSLIEMSADRGAYVDQSQSLNMFTDNPSSNLIQSIHLYGWEKGLKTGMYYLRTKPPVYTQQFTLQVNNQFQTSQTSQTHQSHQTHQTSNSNKNEVKDQQDNVQMENEVQVCRRGDPTCAACSA
jgi:ribonucleoside-diphosphate reductase alpha subunit